MKLTIPVLYKVCMYVYCMYVCMYYVRTSTRLYSGTSNMNKWLSLMVSTQASFNPMHLMQCNFTAGDAATTGAWHSTHDQFTDEW